MKTDGSLSPRLSATLMTSQTKTNFSQCFSWSIWPMPWIFFPGLCHIFYFSLSLLFTPTHFLKPYIKTFKWSVGQGRVFWSYLMVSCYRLMQPIAILLLASSEEASGNCSSLVHKKQPSCMLVTQLQHSIQLSGHYHCLSLYSWIFGFCVLAQILHRAFTGDIAWHYKIKTRSNRKPQTASLEIQSYREKRSTGPLNATEISCTA